MYSDFFLGLLVGLLIVLFISGYVKYYWNNRKGGTLQKPIEEALREPDAWESKKAALEEQYGPITKEVVVTHYIDDVSDNAFFFDASRTLLLMNFPIKYDSIEQYSLSLDGVYVLKVWVEGLPGHYLTQSTNNAQAANELKAELARVVGEDKLYTITEKWN